MPNISHHIVTIHFSVTVNQLVFSETEMKLQTKCTSQLFLCKHMINNMHYISEI